MPVFLPGESHEQRTLVDYSPWGLKEQAMIEQCMHTHTHTRAHTHTHTHIYITESLLHNKLTQYYTLYFSLKNVHLSKQHCLKR